MKKDTTGQNPLKGSRFLLLCNFHSLTEKNKCRLEKFLEVNRPLEGFNNKIKTIKRQEYGFRDMQYFKLRLYDMHTSTYSFAG
ncbi:MAG: hypothetical protein D3910_22980 [Candidatus Electrothrix sp. ATG2]|nr:hypothetical protein [Candidatus Electrothrix sp. ATG2]